MENTGILKPQSQLPPFQFKKPKQPLLGYSPPDDAASRSSAVVVERNTISLNGVHCPTRPFENGKHNLLQNKTLKQRPLCVLGLLFSAVTHDHPNKPRLCLEHGLYQPLVIDYSHAQARPWKTKPGEDNDQPWLEDALIEADRSQGTTYNGGK